MADHHLVPYAQLQARCVQAGGITHPDNALRFIDRDEILHPVPEAFRQHAGIFRKPFRHLFVQPAALPLQACRKVPVIDGHPGPDPLLQQAVDQPVVKVHTGFVHLSRPVRQDTRPGNGKTVVPDPVLRHQGDVLPVPVIVVTRRPSAGPVKNHTGLFTELVPNAGALPVLIPCAFNLVGSSGCSPDKVLRKTHVNASLLCFRSSRQPMPENGSGCFHPHYTKDTFRPTRGKRPAFNAHPQKNTLRGRRSAKGVLFSGYPVIIP